jgi:putative transposase
VEVWAYCLMPNHVHLILTPHGEDGMSRALGEAHRRYTSFINARGRWTGHLFQSRFASVAMDESHLRSAVSYVSLNPVRARLVSRAEGWAWSSVRAHLAGEDDSLVSVRPVLDRWPIFRDLLLEVYEEEFISLRQAH